jgi:hypothetical protein
VRRFELLRNEDPSGVSGTGHVAEGVQFRDGTVVLRWRSRHLSTAIYDDISTVVEIHGHDGSTIVAWIDADHELPSAPPSTRGVVDLQPRSGTHELPLDPPAADPAEPGQREDGARRP